MYPETASNQEPIRLDLQKPDVSKLQLTPEEQKSFTDFLKTKERTEIIHLTQEELVDLKSILDDKTELSQDEITKLNTFVETQSSESFSSSELIPPIEGVENQKEKLHNLDEFSYVYLFKGENEIFKGQNLSEDAKRNFSTALSLYLMENLPAGANIDIKNGVKIIETLTKEKRIGENPKLQPEMGIFFQKLTEKLSLLKNVSSLTLADGGEKNGIFMNPLKGLDFLKNLTSGTNISSIIKDADLKDGEKITISQADNERLQVLSKKVGPLLKEIPENKGDDFGIQQLKENPDMLETLKKLSETKPFGVVFKLILTLLGIGDINEAIEGAHYENIKKSFGKIIGEKNLIVSGRTLGNDFMMKGTEKDMSFVGNLRSLSGKGKPDEAFLKNLLANKSELDQIMTIKKLDAKNGDDINYKNLSEGVSLLVGYKNKKQEKGNENLTIQAYLDSLNKPKDEVTTGEKPAGTPTSPSPEVKGTQTPEKPRQEEQKQIFERLGNSPLFMKTEGNTYIISENQEGKEPQLKLGKDQNGNITSFEFNGTRYELDINWLPDSGSGIKKPTIRFEGDSLMMDGGNTKLFSSEAIKGEKSITDLYNDFKTKKQSILIEDYSLFHDLIIKPVHQKRR